MIRGLIFLLFLFPNNLSAQTVQVRSGEHGEFTRMVLSVPEGVDWNVDANRKEKNILIDLGSAQVSYDLTNIFRRIDRSRIADVEQIGDGKLSVSLACDCLPDAFLLGKNMLVVDIREKTEVEIGNTVVAEKSKEELEPALVQSTATNPLISELARVRIEGGPGIGPRKVADPLLPRLPNRQAAAVNPPLDESSDRQEPMDSAPALGDRLAEDLAAAATAGLLDPAVRPQVFSTPLARDAGEIQSELNQSYVPDAGRAAQELVSAISSAEHGGVKGGRVSVGGDGCVRSSKLDLAGWNDSELDANAFLASQRANIFGEFDAINSEAVDNYAKALLHFGFGAEARALLHMQSDRPDPVLIALSFLVDGESDPTQRFRGQKECETPAALWSVLSGSAVPDSESVDHNSVLRAFEKLPRELKGHLGPILSEKLMQAGYTNTARDILRRLERTQGKESPSVALLRAQFDLAEGNLAEAEHRLKPLSEEGSPETPEAIIARIELAIAKNEAVPQRVVDLATSYSKELKDSEMGHDLWVAYVRSLILNGAFEQAIDDIDKAEGVPNEIVDSLTIEALTRVAENAENLTFLRLTVPVRQIEKKNSENNKLILDISERLVDLKIPDAALSYLDQNSDIEESDRAKIIKGKALIDLMRPEEAEISIIGLKGEEAITLRAEARRQMGDFSLAEEIYSQIGQTENASTSAWLSGNWAGVASGSDGALSDAARLIQSDQVDFDLSDPKLQDAQQLVDQSMTSAQTLRALLDKTRIEGEN